MPLPRPPVHNSMRSVVVPVLHAYSASCMRAACLQNYAVGCPFLGAQFWTVDLPCRRGRLSNSAQRQSCADVRQCVVRHVKNDAWPATLRHNESVFACGSRFPKGVVSCHSWIAWMARHDVSAAEPATTLQRQWLNNAVRRLAIPCTLIPRKLNKGPAVLTCIGAVLPTGARPTWPVAVRCNPAH